MAKKLEVGVVGLGKFGRQLGATLTQLGHRAVGLDIDGRRAALVQEDMAQVYVADATDKNALTQLRFQDLETVVVSVGTSMEASILIALNLQELGVNSIIAKANSLAHRKILSRLGVSVVVQPEADVAVRMANKLANPGMLDLLPVGGGVLIQEATIQEWAGKSLLELDIRQQNGVLVAAVKRAEATEYTFVPNPATPFQVGEMVLLIGRQKDVLALRT